MSNIRISLCVGLVLVMVSSSLVPASAANPDTEGNITSEQMLESLREWATMQPGHSLPDGRVMPISGTQFFREHPEMAKASPHLETDAGVAGSRGTGSRAWDLKATGVHCRVYVNTNSNPYPNDTKVTEVMNEFDNILYPNDTAWFGSTNPVIDVNILALDGPWGVGGYFSGGPDIQVDSADLNSWGYEIIAHEFQHQIHANHDPGEMLWLNEGCADFAIEVNYGTSTTVTIPIHVGAFEHTPDNDLTLFENAQYDYGSAYSYISYISEHYGNQTFIKNLVASPATGLVSVGSAIGSMGGSDSGIQAFYKWTVANILDDPSLDQGQWGYRNLDITVTSTTKDSYPATVNGKVENFAADYYDFTYDGNLDLEITFTKTSGNFKPYLAALGRAGTGTQSNVVQMTGNRAVINNFGSEGNYSKVYFIVAAEAGGSYSFTANVADLTPPTSMIHLDPPVPSGTDGYYLVTPALTFSVNDGAAAVHYMWDNGTNITWAGSAFNAPEGEHSLSWAAVDMASNWEMWHTFELKVDTVASMTNYTTVPSAPNTQGWFNKDTKVTLTNDDIAHTKMFYHWNNETDIQYTGPFTAPEGENTLYFHSTDAHDHVEVQRSAVIRVDTVIPETKMNMTPAEPDGLDGWFITAPTITLESEPGSVISYRWNDGEMLDFEAPFVPPQGTNVLHYYATDMADNVESEKEMTFMVDTSVPGSDLNAPDPNGKDAWYVTKPSIELVQDSQPDINTRILFRWNDGVESEYGAVIEALEGINVLTFYAIDQAGNKEEAHEVTFHVDTLVPVTNIELDPDHGKDQWYNEEPTITFMMENDTTVFYHWDGDRDEAYKQGQSIQVPEGKSTLYYHGQDEAGNTELEKNRALRLDTTGPKVELKASATSASTKTDVSFDASGSTDANGIAKYWFDFGDGKESGWSTDPALTHQYTKAGNYKVTVTVVDVAGNNGTTSLSIKVTEQSGPMGSLTGGLMAPLLVLVMVIVVVVAAVLAVAFMRKKRGQQTAPPQPQDQAPQYMPPQQPEYAPAPPAQTYQPEPPPPASQATPEYAPGAQDQLSYSQGDTQTTTNYDQGTTQVQDQSYYQPGVPPQ